MAPLLKARLLPEAAVAACPRHSQIPACDWQWWSRTRNSTLGPSTFIEREDMKRFLISFAVLALVTIVSASSAHAFGGRRGHTYVTSYVPTTYVAPTYFAPVATVAPTVVTTTYVTPAVAPVVAPTYVVPTIQTVYRTGRRGR
jgi:hypothetical protein